MKKSDFPYFLFTALLIFAAILLKTYYCKGDFCLDFSNFQLGGESGRIISRAFWYYFAHDGIDHFLENMLVFSLFFYYFEKELNVIYPIIIFLLSAVISGILFLYLDPCSSNLPVVGASGGDFGLMGAFFAYTSKGRIHFFPFFKNPLVIRFIRAFMKILILLFLLYGLYSLQKRTNCEYLSHSIHIFGFFVGVLLIILDRVKKRYYQ